MAQLTEKNGVRVAVEGCGHGTLHSIYASIDAACKIKGWHGVDLLIIGGDFQAVRNALDLNCMSVPVKYRDIADFHEYYSGSRQAPYLTVFVGGNHEASNYLWELYYGGWVAPNIYYMGAANVLRIGPLRIAGLSGIWKGYNYKKPHHERLPYNQDDVKSFYHVREIDVRKLLQIRTQVDIGISHDWPRGIEWKGNWKQLFRAKIHFEEDARNGNLGSVAAKYVMDRLRPAYWFSAHLHIKYKATVEYAQEPTQEGHLPPATANGSAVDAKTTANSDEIDLDMDDEGMDEPASAAKPDLAAGMKVEQASEVPADLRAQLPAAFTKSSPTPRQPTLPFPPTITNRITQFLALDKCLPNREFLQILDITPLVPPDDADSLNLARPLHLEYDPEWLAITRAFATAEPLRLGDPSASVLPDKGSAAYLPLIQEAEAWVESNVVQAGKLTIPENFTLTAPIFIPGKDRVHVHGSPKEYSNPQTRAFCNLIGIENQFHAEEEEIAERMKMAPRQTEDRSGFHRERGSARGQGRGRGGFGGRQNKGQRGGFDRERGRRRK
ncbi:lariat debranching enzyme [Aulographum hederae CBS 113979]|uniref:Lariat debranching enzyme n=1 Tax=Aulographum hederae CBS 113979 TaxID=1176131 RepID=A0A6G1GKF1_9PEZI|nr:lariat debranching enzyme [Aulographum hederae CBS 113979]